MPSHLGEELGGFLPHAAEGQPINESPEHLGEGHEGAGLLLRSERAGPTDHGPAAVGDSASDQRLAERQGAEPGGELLTGGASPEITVLRGRQPDLAAVCPDAGHLFVRTCMLGCRIGTATTKPRRHRRRSASVHAASSGASGAELGTEYNVRLPWG